MIEFRKRHPALHRGQFFTGVTNERGLIDLAWHGTKLNNPGWLDPGGRALAMTLAGFSGDVDIHVMFNMYWESLAFALPSMPRRIWLKAVDTSQPPPLDIADFGDELPVAARSVYTVQGRSVVVLVNRADDTR
jgi:glycogen operon protein